MFRTTLDALDKFKLAIHCAYCRKNGETLQTVGNSCKHAFCWTCITDLTGKNVKRGYRPACPVCVLPLNGNDIKDASTLNNCKNILDELTELFGQLEKAPAKKETMVQHTQNIMQTLNVVENPRTVEEFLATQPMFVDDPDVPEGVEDGENPYTNVFERERSDSPEIDLFAPTTSTKPEPFVPPTPPTKRRGQSPHVGEDAKKFKEDDGLFQTQCQTKQYEGNTLTPFLSRKKRNFTENYSYLNTHVQPLKSHSEMPSISKEDEAFTKRVPLPRRSSTSSAKRPVQTTSATILFGNSAKKSQARSSKHEDDENIDRSASSSPVDDVFEQKTSVPAPRRSSMTMKRGEAVILNSIQENRIKQLECAINSGANVNEKDSDGRTPLYLAVELNNTSAVKRLVEGGALVDAACGTRFETALHLAVSLRHHSVVNYLLEKGASLTSRDIWQMTPVDKGAGDAKMRKIFQKYQSTQRIINKIPPKRSEFFFIRLLDSSYLSKEQVKMLPGRMNLVKGNQPATHLVVKTEKGCCSLTEHNLQKILEALTKSHFLVSLSWLEDSISQEKYLDERKYEVRRLRVFEDGSIATDSAVKWRHCKERMQIPLFTGCVFRCVGKNFNYMSKAAWENIVVLAGGKLYSDEVHREDKGDGPKPYHGPHLTTHFAIYNVRSAIPNYLSKNESITCVSEQWLIDSILSFCLKTPY